MAGVAGTPAVLAKAGLCCPPFASSLSSLTRHSISSSPPLPPCPDRPIQLFIAPLSLFTAAHEAFAPLSPQSSQVERIFSLAQKMADHQYNPSYPYNNQYHTTYPPHSDHGSDDEFKHPYDNGIIDSYATTQVSLPIHNVQPSGRPDFYPPLGAKPSYSSTTTDVSEIQSPTHKGGGTFGGSTTVLEKQEKQSFWQRVRLGRLIGLMSPLTFFLHSRCSQIQWHAGYTS